MRDRRSAQHARRKRFKFSPRLFDERKNVVKHISFSDYLAPPTDNNRTFYTDDY